MYTLFEVCIMLLVVDLVVADQTVDTTVAAQRSWKSHQVHRKKNDPDKRHYDAKKGKRPNIILVMTDDQDVELGSLNYMPEVNRILRTGGAEFRHAYTTTPMCCPSRSSMLTGLYVHNHNVYTNNDNCSSIQWQVEHETRSFASYLYNAGYHTGYYGKYLNKYNGSYIPPGWTEWGGLIMNSKYYNYSINSNGKRIKHGDDYYKDYYPDLITNDSISFLREWKVWNNHKPSLLVMSFPAPHGPEDSAPQYSNEFFNVSAHHTPSYDYAPNPDKQWILQVTGRMLPIHKDFTDLLMTKRLQTLQSVDFAVRKIYETLKEIDELDNTYLIYTSDHGYHLGQFGLVKGKSFPFEFDIRVPFLVKGPGVEQGSIINEIALNIDIAPTILDLAGVVIPPHMDGRSLMKLFHRRRKSNRKHIANWPNTFLIESSGRREPFPKISNVNVAHHKKILSGEDLMTVLNHTNHTADTEARVENLNILSDKISIVEPSLIQALDNEDGFLKEDHINNRLLGTSGIRKSDRLSLECQRSELSFPCKHGQKWHCVLEDNRWRKHKCRYSITADASPLPNLQKCSCITEDGVIYVRFQAVNGSASHRGFNKVPNQKKMEEPHPAVVHYIQSNKTSDELVNELAKTWRTMKRHRRHASNLNEFEFDVSSVIDVLQNQMNELQNVKNGSSNISCTVMPNDTVICSEELYRNPNVWKASQENIAQQIRNLQRQMHKLKNIQRHLEEKQPLFSSISSTLHPDTISTVQDMNSESNVHDAASTSSTTSRFLETSTTRKHRHKHYDTSTSTNIPPTMSYYEIEDDIWNEEQSNSSIPDTCYCVPHLSDDTITTAELLKEQKRRIKDQRLKKKERKLKKRAKFENQCFLEKMNCFYQDNTHWKTPPYWTEGPFCFCMNANNNTYNCLRTINSTHNFLYCEFVTGLITYYNVRLDPFQQWNRYPNLGTEEKYWLRDTLSNMLKCKGANDCDIDRNKSSKRNVDEYWPTKKQIKSEVGERRSGS